MRIFPTPKHRAAASLTLAVALTVPFVATADAPTIGVRVVDPPSLSFDATALGHATHALRFIVTNLSSHVVELKPLAFRFRPIREGVAFTCDETPSSDDRWPSTLEANASVSLARAMTCETPLPGRYEIELRGRPRGAPDSTEQTYGSFALVIEPGANPPVRPPWEPSLRVAAAGTKDMRPSKDPAAARLVILLANGSRAPVTLAPLRATMRVTRRGSTVAPCPEHGIDLAFRGTLEPGHTQSLATPLGCELSAEAVYDVDIAVANAAGAKVHVATHAIRVGVIPPPPPRPEDQPGKIIGGM